LSHIFVVYQQFVFSVAFIRIEMLDYAVHYRTFALAARSAMLLRLAWRKRMLVKNVLFLY